MATRYWVGGTGTWNSSSTTNWSATSGGTGGASVPTSADDVIFNGSSGGGTCTLSSPIATLPCKSFDATGYTGTFTAASFVYITVGNGNVNLGSASYNGAVVGISHSATSGSYTANLNGKNPYYSFSGSNAASITLSGVTNATYGIAVQTAATATFSDASIVCTNNSFLIDSCGTVNLGSGSITCRYVAIIRNTSISGSRSVTLSASGQSALTNLQSGGISSINVSGGTTVQLNAFSGTHPTTTVSSTSGLIYLAGSGSFGSVSIGAGTGLDISGGIASISSINITSSCPTVTCRGGPTIGTLTTGSSVTKIELTADQTISTLNVTGPVGTTTINSTAAGTRRILTVSSFSLSKITWKDIDAAGNIPFTGTDFVDGGNNLDIQFTVPGQGGLFFGSNF